LTWQFSIKFIDSSILLSHAIFACLLLSCDWMKNTKKVKFWKKKYFLFINSWMTIWLNINSMMEKNFTVLWSRHWTIVSSLLFLSRLQQPWYLFLIKKIEKETPSRNWRNWGTKKDDKRNKKILNQLNHIFVAQKKMKLFVAISVISLNSSGFFFSIFSCSFKNKYSSHRRHIWNETLLWRGVKRVGFLLNK
jgi:hypothetical protein